MRNLQDLIVVATRHVADGRRIVQWQRDLIASGTKLPGAINLLARFERSQAIFEDDLDRLLKKRLGHGTNSAYVGYSTLGSKVRLCASIANR
jgi:hypothetical protein